jgi:predicted metal-dependent hydrolase
MAEARYDVDELIFPLQLEDDNGFSEAIKWFTKNHELEINVSVPSRTTLEAVVPHCLLSKEKVEAAISDQEKLGPSLFHIFPHTLSTIHHSMWSHPCTSADHHENKTKEQFQERLKDFITVHAMNGVRNHVAFHIQAFPVKSQNIPVRSLY